VIPSIIGAVIGFLHAVLPMREINEKLFPLRDETTTDDKYSELRVHFIEVFLFGEK